VINQAKTHVTPLETCTTACGLQTSYCLTSLCDPRDICRQSSRGRESRGKWGEVVRKQRI